MKIGFYITMFVLGISLAFNIYFLFNTNLYTTVFGYAISIVTFAALLTFLVMTMIRRKKLKKDLHSAYDKIFSKN